MKTTLNGYKHDSSCSNLLSIASKKLLTPIIFSPFGIKHQKEKKRKRTNTHSSSSWMVSQSTSSPPAGPLAPSTSSSPPPSSLSSEEEEEEPSPSLGDEWSKCGAHAWCSSWTTRWISNWCVDQALAAPAPPSPHPLNLSQKG